MGSAVLHFRQVLVFGLVTLGLVGCGPSGNALPDGGELPALPDVTSPQAVANWLAAEGYKSWTCENQATVKVDGDPAIHVHGTNRVCVNSTLKSAPAGQPLPQGSAAVKEIYVSGMLTKRYFEMKVQTDSAGGQGWYWYDGAVGSAGTGARGRSECVGCHTGAGSDAMHPGRGDFVYFVP